MREQPSSEPITVRRITNILVMLSLLLAAASAGLWVRSFIATDAWVFNTPTAGPGWSVPEFRGWQRQRLIQSHRGRLVWYERDAPAYPVVEGYVRLPRPELPRARSHSLPNAKGGSIPGVAEWFYLPGGRLQTAPNGYSQWVGESLVSVTWLAFVLAGAIPPVAWVMRRRRKARGHAFPVTTHDPESSG